MATSARKQTRSRAASKAGGRDESESRSAKSTASRSRSHPGSSDRKSNRESSTTSARRGTTRRSAAKSGRREAGGAGQTTTNHEEIRAWVEERGGKPACVRGTGGKEDIGMLRIDMPGYTGADKLAPISWDDWFEKFDEKGLAFLHQDKTAGGKKSNFNKLVSR